MKTLQFDQWVADLPQLNQAQRRLVANALHPTAGLDRIVALIEWATIR